MIRPRTAHAAAVKGPEETQQVVVANRARLIVNMPDQARLYVDDMPIQAASPMHSFQTPELEKGREYYYEVRAEVMRDGKPVSETRRVTVKAGDVIRTDFNLLGGASAVASSMER